MPWNQRKALLTHHRWFRNLTDFQSITRSWLEESQGKRAPHQVERVAAAHFPENFKFLETLPDARLESLLDDTTPEDLLNRLEYSVWAAQAWTFASLMNHMAADEKEKLQSVLEQATWKQGRLVAEKRWSLAEKQDLRALFLTLVDSPVALSLGEDAFLLRRGLSDDLEFEFRFCPHFSRFPEVKPVADELCFLHSAWIKGYIYGLNTQVKIEYRPAPLAETQASQTHSRCGQHWTL
jgi:hypothetical protein